VTSGVAECLRRTFAGEPTLCLALERLLEGDSVATHLESESLVPGRVTRLVPAGREPLESLVVKRLPFDRSNREQRALRHWLPGLGLDAHAVRLRGIVPGASEASVWHVYEDLGDHTLERACEKDPDQGADAIHAAMALVSTLHLRFAAQPVLMDCRLAGLDLGAAFFRSAVVDAQRSLTTLRSTLNPPNEWEAPIDAVLGRLALLQEEFAARCAAFEALGWPETLLHGDLWLQNVVVEIDGQARCVRLIDWERTGVGSPLYDLSTLLRQLPSSARAGALATYRYAVESAGWAWPSSTQLEGMAETCEFARFASCLAWRVLPFLETRGDGELPPAWLLDDLVEMEGWFAERTPLLPSRCAA
jgi:hypothetical protein